MKRIDPALTCSNPRLIAAVYFGLLSVVATILINALLTSIGIREEIPVFKAILLGMVVASCVGFIMGEHIIHCKKPYKKKTFFMGFAMVIASLPVFDLGLVVLMHQENASLFSVASLGHMVFFYLYTLVYSYLIFGILLAIGSGFATMYLRGQLVYDILATYQPRKRMKRLPKSPVERNKIEHADNTHLVVHKARTKRAHGLHARTK
jgi:hypothetical protein